MGLFISGTPDSDTVLAGGSVPGTHGHPYLTRTGQRPLVIEMSLWKRPRKHRRTALLSSIMSDAGHG